MSASNEAEKEAAAILDAAGILGGDEKEAAVQYAKIQNSVNQQQAQIMALMDRNAAERIKLAVDLENQVEQARVDAMADGFDKELAQRNLDDKKSMQALEEQKKEYIDAVVQGQKEVFDAQENLRASQDQSYVKKMFDPSSVSVDTSVFDELFDRYKEKSLSTYAEVANERDRIESESIDKEVAAMNRYLAEYGTYQEKRAAIADEFTQKIINAETEGEKMSLTEQMTDALSELDMKATETTSAIGQLFGDMRKKSVNELREIADRGEEALSFITSGEWDSGTGIRLGMSKETFESLQDDTEQLESMRDAIDKIRDSADSMDDAFSQIWNGIGKMIKSASGDTEDFVDGLDLVSEGMGKLQSVTGFLSDSFSQLGETFGSDVLDAIGEGLDAVSSAMDSAVTGMQAGSIFGPIGAAAGAAIGAVTSLVSSISQIHDKKIQKDIDDLQDQVDDLTDSYEILGRQIEETYSTSAAKLLREQNQMLENQRLLIEQQMAAELKKKNADEDALDGYRDALDEINEKIEENGKALQEAVTGVSFDSFRNGLLDMLLDADATVEDFAEDFSQTIQKAIFNSLLAEKYDGRIKALYEEFARAAEDGLTETEVDYLRGIYGKLVDDLYKEKEQINDSFGFGGGAEEEGEDEERTSASKGIAQASQDSVDELNGRATAIQGHTFSISNDMKLLVNTSSMMLERLTGIENNTARLEVIENDISEMRTDISTMVLKGLKLRS